MCFWRDWNGAICLGKFIDRILVTEDKITKMNNHLTKLLDMSIGEGKALLIIGEVDGQALETLLVNATEGKVPVSVVKGPGFGDRKKEIMNDIAILTGGTFITSELGLKIEEATIDMLGRAEKVTVGKDSTTIVNGAGKSEDIKGRIKQIQAEMDNSTSDYDKEKLQERLAKLSGGVAVLYIGAASEVEMKEKKDRVDDALAATRAAVEEGIVAGGGVAFVRAIESIANLEGANADENTGINIIRRALEEPLRQIVANAGGEGSVVIQRVKDGKKDFGYNARTDVFENLIAAGVIDPTKVSRVALENAASVASMLLTTECLIVDIPEDEKGHGHAPDMGGMGGMM